jgi:hypothetical protein
MGGSALIVPYTFIMLAYAFVLIQQGHYWRGTGLIVATIALFYITFKLADFKVEDNESPHD